MIGDLFPRDKHEQGFFEEWITFFEIIVDLGKKLPITFDSPVRNHSPSVEWWNWQTRMIKGHVPRGVRVQVPPRPPLFSRGKMSRLFCGRLGWDGPGTFTLRVFRFASRPVLSVASLPRNMSLLDHQPSLERSESGGCHAGVAKRVGGRYFSIPFRYLPAQDYGLAGHPR